MFTGLAVNSYQVVIDDGNCQTIGSILVVSAPSTPPAPTAGVSAIYCEGDAISDLTAAASMGGTLTWYDDAGLTNIVGTGVTFSPNTTAGNYTYYVTEVASGCEGSSSQITVDINAVPTATVTGGGTICFGEPFLMWLLLNRLFPLVNNIHGWCNSSYCFSRNISIYFSEFGRWHL